jgi:phage FluMu gp28-like protein
MTIKLPNLHPAQREVARALLKEVRFGVLCAGRRFGKSWLGVPLCLRDAHEGGIAWWVAPDYKRTVPAWRLARAWGNAIPGTNVLKGERMIEFKSGGELWIKSADDPDGLRGEGLTMLVLDEFAFAKSGTWKAVRPAVLARKGHKPGRVLFISTPNGRNEFHRLFVRGQDPEYPDWRSWQFPTSANPYIPPEEIERERRESTDLEFRQEYLAEFVSDSGIVFRDFRACVYGELGQIARDENARYYMGVDLAQMNDFSVLTVVETGGGENGKKRVVDIDRFNMMDWATQRQRIKALAAKWGVEHVVIEANSIGGVNIEELRDDPALYDVSVEAFTTTNESKAEMIRDLIYAFETGGIAIPNYPPLLKELEIFEISRLPSGKFRYAAGGAGHDDTVISLGLALRATEGGFFIIGLG